MKIKKFVIAAIIFDACSVIAVAIVSLEIDTMLSKCIAITYFVLTLIIAIYSLHLINMWENNEI